jgi:hypothetical protein
MDAIDDMLADLHAARPALVGEIRASDDATNARIDAMLAIPLEDRLAAREAGIRRRRRAVTAGCSRQRGLSSPSRPPLSPPPRTTRPQPPRRSGHSTGRNRAAVLARCVRAVVSPGSPRLSTLRSVMR